MYILYDRDVMHELTNRIARQSHLKRTKNSLFLNNNYNKLSINKIELLPNLSLSLTEDHIKIVSDQLIFFFNPILNFLTVFNYLSTILKCKECNSNVNFTRTGKRGLGFKLNITCQCSSRCVESCPLINHAYEINCRIMFMMRLLGLELQGINLFCGMMDLSVEFGNFNLL